MRWCCRSNSLLDTGGLMLGMQTDGSIQQEEEQDASKKLQADVGVCGLVTLGGQVCVG